MKNVQVIDGALNCTYSIYAVSDRIFRSLFPRKGQDIEFSEDAFERIGHKAAAPLFKSIWKRRINKETAKGIHGTLFFGLTNKKEYYPNKREADLSKLKFNKGRFVLKS
ncbi:MAG: hypothetical protein ACREBW_03995 [Candidatus Micrarchaeaceae archaeon]